MKNNLKVILPLLKWDDPNKFYFIQVLQRKKDAMEGQIIAGTNNNARLIKAYYVYSEEHLIKIMPEIIALCNVFNARAGINLNRRDKNKIALLHQKKTLYQMINGNEDKAYKAYSSVCGAFMHEKKTDKKWIVDIDKEDMPYLQHISDIIMDIQNKQGSTVFVYEVESQSGVHLITTPFNTVEFNRAFPGIDIQKNNPTNLYIP